MNALKERLEQNKKENDILTPEMIASMDPETEYIKDNEIYCKTCNTQRTCFGISRKVRCESSRNAPSRNAQSAYVTSKD